VKWWGVQATLKPMNLPSGTRFSLTAGYDQLPQGFRARSWIRNGPVTFFGQAELFPNGIQPISQPVQVEALQPAKHACNLPMTNACAGKHGRLFQRAQRRPDWTIWVPCYLHRGPRAETKLPQNSGNSGQVQL